MAFQRLGNRADFNPCGMAGPIDLGIAGGHHEFRITSGKLFQIGLERARIVGQVLVRSELARIDVDPHDRQVALGLRCPHETQMSVMERPHRRHQADPFSRAAIGQQGGADFSDRGENVGKHVEGGRGKAEGGRGKGCSGSGPILRLHEFEI